MTTSDQDQHPFFVRVSAPDMLRVSILETSKLTLHSLQSYYKVTNIRKKKRESSDLLKSQVKELILLLSKLDAMLPYQEVVTKNMTPTQAKNSSSRKAKKSVKNASKEMVDTATTTSFSELDKLNRALASVEEKLNKLV